MSSRFRISGPARADLAAILAASLDRWGEQGRARHAALLVAAMRAIARRPDAPTTRARPELLPGTRSFHLKHARRGTAVEAPAHVLFYRQRGEVVEIVRVLHERMEPARHLPTSRSRRRTPQR